MRWIGSSDAYKAAVERREAAKRDYAAEFAALEAEAVAIKAEGASERATARRLESLRIQWRAVKAAQQFAATGRWAQ